MKINFCSTFVHYTGLQTKPSYKQVQVLRGATTDEQKTDVYIFYEHLIQSVVGHKMWRKSRVKVLISDAVTASQEATALWILKNYEETWNNQHKTIAQFTGSTRGNRRFKGWSAKGIDEYNSITKSVLEDRKKGTLFEEHFKMDQFNKLNMNKRKNHTNQIYDVSANDISVYDDLVMAESDMEDNQYASFTIDHEPSYNTQSPISHETQSTTDVSFNNTDYQNLYPDINNQVGDIYPA
jgi:hypothetical protein